MIVFATKEFWRFVRKAGIEREHLVAAAEEITADRCDADLGGGIFKQRIARAGGGKSGGFRTIIAFRVGHHCFFIHGFAKNDKANVSTKELLALKQFAGLLFDFSDAELERAVEHGELIRIIDNDDSQKEKS